MWSCDPRRFTALLPTRTIASPRAWRSTATNTRCTFPHHAWPAGRDKQAVAGARPDRRARRASSAPTTAGSGPTGSRSPATTRPRPPRRPGTATGPGSPRVREECLAVRDARRHSRPARLLALPRRRARARAEWLSRPDHRRRAEARAHRPRLFRRRSAAASSPKCRSCALDEDVFLLITAAAAQWHDLEWLQASCPPDAAIASDDRHRGLRLPDPDRAEVARRSWPPSADADLSLPWLTHQAAQIAGRWCAAGARFLRRRTGLGNPCRRPPTRRRSTMR